MHILYDLDSIKNRSEKEKAMPPKNKNRLLTDLDFDIFFLYKTRFVHHETNYFLNNLLFYWERKRIQDSY